MAKAQNPTKTQGSYTRRTASGQGRAPYRAFRRRGYGQKVVVSKTLRKAIKQEIFKDVENKKTMYQSGDLTFNQTLNTTTDVLQILPDVVNGTAENQKTGNVITVKSLQVRGVLTFFQPQLTASNTRIGVRLMVIRTKRFDDYLAARSDFATNYTKLLEGQSTGWTGITADFNTPVNDDYFTVLYDKRIYFSQSLSSANTSNSDNRYTTAFVNFKMPMKGKKLHYDQNFDGDTPVDFAYYMLLSYVKLDGIPDGDGTTYLKFNYNSRLDFLDA